MPPRTRQPPQMLPGVTARDVFRVQACSPVRSDQVPELVTVLPESEILSSRRATGTRSPVPSPPASRRRMLSAERGAITTSAASMPPQLIAAGSVDVDDSQPRLVALDDLLPVALERVSSLERVVTGQQMQLNELVPMQGEILDMLNALSKHHSAVVGEIREAHDALCQDHFTICDCLAQAGLVAPTADFCKWEADQCAGVADSASGAPALWRTALGDAGLASSICRAAGSSAWRSLSVASRTLHAGARQWLQDVSATPPMPALETAPPVPTASVSVPRAGAASASCNIAPHAKRTQADVAVASAIDASAAFAAFAATASLTAAAVPMSFFGGSSSSGSGALGGGYPTVSSTAAASPAVAAAAPAPTKSAGEARGFNSSPEAVPNAPLPWSRRATPQSKGGNLGSPARGPGAVGNSGHSGVPSPIAEPASHGLWAIGGRASASSDLAGAAAAWQAVDHVEVLLPGAECWEALPPLTQARVQHRTQVLGMALYVIGGQDQWQVLSSCERLDFLTGKWEVLQPMWTQRSGHDLCVLGGLIYALGGYDGVSRLTLCECLDPKGGHWGNLPPLAVPRQGHTALSLEDRIFVVGGCEGASMPAQQAAVESFDSLNGWQALPPLLGPWNTLSAAAVAGRLYVVSSQIGRRVAAAVERWEPAVGRWVALPRLEQMHVCLASAEAVGKLFVFSRLSHQTQADMCQCFDPATGQWEQLPPLAVERTQCRALSFGGSLYVHGPGAAAEEAECVAERWDPATRRWVQLPALSRLGCELTAVSFRRALV